MLEEGVILLLGDVIKSLTMPANLSTLQTIWDHVTAKETLRKQLFHGMKGEQEHYNPSFYLCSTCTVNPVSWESVKK